MRFPERQITLKDGRTCILRPTGPEVAAEMSEYMRKTADETPWLLRYPDEVNCTLEGEKDILGRLLDDPCSVMMMAEVDGRVAGNCSVSGIGNKRKILHRCSVAIALYRDYWNLGSGRAMMDYLSELVAPIGFRQMALEVVAENTQAQALYRKCGFIETGRRHHALRFDDGSMHDEILMYKEL